MEQKKEGKQKRKKRENVYYLSIEDANKLIETTKTLRDRVILKILIRTGIRRFELCNILMQDIDFQNKQIYIRKAKGEKPRSVPIDNDTIQDIKFYIGSRQYGKLIQSNKKGVDGIDESRINGIVRVVAEKAGIKHPDPTKKHMNPHIFRHSFIRHLIKEGVPPNYVQKLAGHSDIRTTLEMYGKPSFKDLQEKYDEITNTFYRKHKPIHNEQK